MSNAHTPAQVPSLTVDAIADEILWDENGEGVVDRDTLRDMLTRASGISHVGRLEDLHAYDYVSSDDDGDDDGAERILIIQADAGPEIGRVRVYVNDGRVYDGNPETGQEWPLV